jgi:tetratricopeptide (TPR) repeat protein
MKGWMAAVQQPEIQQPKNQYRDVALAYIALANGKHDEVARTMEAYGQKFANEKMWWNRIVGADALLVAALAYEKLGQPARAAQLVESSLAVFDDPGFNKSASYYKRRLARARALLAKLLNKSNPETAKSLANEALAWYRQAGGYNTIISGLEAL